MWFVGSVWFGKDFCASLGPAGDHHLYPQPFVANIELGEERGAAKIYIKIAKLGNMLAGVHTLMN